MRIGVDVGGTNTDAVLIDGRQILTAHKALTSADIAWGIKDAIATVMEAAKVPPSALRAVMIGTTQFTNAFVERRCLNKVGIIRLAGAASRSLLPFVDWPRELLAAVEGKVFLAAGGYHFDGTPIAALDPTEIERAALEFRSDNLQAVVVSSIFAPVSDVMEREAREIVQRVIPHAQVTLSSEIGRVGLIERENAAIMNASLADLAAHVIDAFAAAIAGFGITAPFFISQNDGTLMAPDQVRRFPVLTFASGPTNSMRGAAFLSGLKDAVVVDVGGTTTDVGVLKNGFPRESAMSSDIGGIRTNFRMPDVLSIGLGGGSIVSATGVGPQSVGYRIRDEARVFGGSTITATDIAVAIGRVHLGNGSAMNDVGQDFIASAEQAIRDGAEQAIDRMRSSSTDVPVVLVGGGAIILPDDLRGAARAVRPPYAEVANAVGASLALVGGEVDRVFSYAKQGRDAALDQAKTAAFEAAAGAGAARETIEIVELEELPLAYMPGGAVRVRAKAVGALVLAG